MAWLGGSGVRHVERAGRDGTFGMLKKLLSCCRPVVSGLRTLADASWIAVRVGLSSHDLHLPKADGVIAARRATTAEEAHARLDARPLVPAVEDVPHALSVGW